MFDDGSPGEREWRDERERPGAADGGTPGAPRHPGRPLDPLADGRRRRLLRYLAAREGDTASFVELVAHAVRREDDRDVERVAVSLSHRHLPELEAAGLVEFDARSRTVRYRGDDEVEARLERAERAGREGPR